MSTPEITEPETEEQAPSEPPKESTTPRFQVLVISREEGHSEYQVLTRPSTPVTSQEVATHLSGMVFEFLKQPDRVFGDEPVPEAK
tara:strand:+ start:309 stop:566 length:258 start_codon:yes stop_codon:yes gene_type:complete